MIRYFCVRDNMEAGVLGIEGWQGRGRMYVDLQNPLACSSEQCASDLHAYAHIKHVSAAADYKYSITILLCGTDVISNRDPPAGAKNPS